MSSKSYRSQLDSKRKARIDAEKKAGVERAKESKKRSEAVAKRLSATKSISEATQKSRQRDAERLDKDAERAGKAANEWDAKAARYRTQEADLEVKMVKAQQRETAEAEKKRTREQGNATRRAAQVQRTIESRVSAAESTAAQAVRQLATPKPEKLRVLMLGASAQGDLRIAREQSRIRKAVEAALHRDHIVLDARASATTEDILDGIGKFRPHIVHFSGHSDDDVIEFEDDLDAHHDGVIVTATAFANAVHATDTPPALVLFNSCKSAGQAEALTDRGVIPFAVGMADSIGDSDAITYAARFYAAIANGQSVTAAHAQGVVALELAGLDSSDLPTLTTAADHDPSNAIFVTGD